MNPEIAETIGIFKIGTSFAKNFSFSCVTKIIAFDSFLDGASGIEGVTELSTKISFSSILDFLESEIRKAINSVGLEYSIGFLHEINQSRTPLVYDIQELFRWIIDISVIQLLEDNKVIKKIRFYRYRKLSHTIRRKCCKDVDCKNQFKL